VSDAAKQAIAAEYELNRPKVPKSQPRWMSVANGRLYRTAMRVMHRFGWCYPERTLVSERGVWCHWCGMRGTK
jgi:hypothetical protein